jgi:hypothetical protein
MSTMCRHTGITECELRQLRIICDLLDNNVILPSRLPSPSPTNMPAKESPRDLSQDNRIEAEVKTVDIVIQMNTSPVDRTMLIPECDDLILYIMIPRVKSCVCLQDITPS